MTSASDRRATGGSVLLAITSLRIVLTPVVIGLVLIGERVRGATVAGLVVFTVAALTDLVDGYVARRWGRTTEFGSFLDTTADKLLVSGVLIGLVAVGRASPWASFLIVGRELLVLGLRAVMAARGTHVEGSVWGRWKAAAQLIAIGLAIVRPPVLIGPLLLDEWALWLAVLITVGSGVEYFSRFPLRPAPADQQ
ncbi:MAG TPA: CDP-diacylglycerol--glycerol-3-phosphate 3-phosphatidyltransferase [Nitriliruptorales bacterium]|nr:CDP-diacylglycerol--glycerol-3-phosphate 3-phosphatidyltransferase [Nitriliruptorales bacterium]